MNLPVPLPAWLPWWVPLVVLIPALLYTLLFLLMPFSVFGLKGRLDVIEARLDEIQTEIRTLTLRLPERDGDSEYAVAEEARVQARPTIPPAAGRVRMIEEPDVEEPPPMPPRRDMRLGGRSTSAPEEPRRRSPREEPRLDWPRDSG